MTALRPRAETYIQSLFDQDRGVVPKALRDASFEDPGYRLLTPEWYTSHEIHDLEVNEVWRRVWQMACREEDIPNVGDYVVYDIADMSLIVIRSTSERVQAFHNSCLHRGTQLRTGTGHSKELRCPYHGFTWTLEGALSKVPSNWDFPDLDPLRLCLPEARVGTWGGFVFVNMDDNAPPLTEYLEVLPAHFASWPLENRYKTAHVIRKVACNWKVALEAFIEAFHVVAVHPQLLKTVADTLTEYDIWPHSRHVSRMITAVGMSSAHLESPLPESEVAALLAGKKALTSDGVVARHVAADDVRRRVSERAGRDIEMSDAEALDGTEYFLFPNFMPWMSYTTPLAYRFRPDGNNPDSSIMDVMLLEPLPESGRPPAAKPHVLGDDETFLDAPELGFLGPILNQDFSTLPRVQRGLRASSRGTFSLAHYQEGRIRHFHATLQEYVRGPGRTRI